ncbi:UNVERIFIED_ORG: hypothetical protein M2438_001180 [Methylobacterium sp. SuP10 SLI 274]|uniref:hypothetical protein n=1 Tax=Methylorubrum extorquens TaxID=408 RepID=UPI0020A11353|nr:hypothetical protein [Methylorubrum extorquens]MDF9862390.1 hypothetical protein [Methylorubrum pseudosasae]MDH6636005.1 hypothetical protein [Methylobacterium sp. SuP10 SLI 274]MDH6665180.1 hypothetical protein [Methylorubrum zatmanii]MCP1557107.1 hypothetical protein [Methylorubrum extorquens]MDF9790684.1 hypothetical protein [Methylorubrum extorquens]
MKTLQVRFIALAVILGGASAAPSTLAWAQTAVSPAVNNWAELRAALASCWTVPADTEGSQIAFRFGLNKTGGMRGPALVTSRQLKGDQEARKRFEDAAFEALSRCFPMRITPAFGAILGESPIRLRLVNAPPTAAYQINNNITIFAPR